MADLSVNVSSADLERLLDKLRAGLENPAEGIFGPRSISWQINRESALFLAAGRAALLQLAHPWVAAGIAEHSTTLRDPVRRFHQTFRVVFTMVFGSLDQAIAAARHLHRRHQAIRGAMPDNVGPFPQGTPYEANEIAALRWVYATLVDSAITAYELVLPPLQPTERERYYSESRTLAALFGIPADCLPQDWNAFAGYLQSMYRSNVLAVSPSARSMAHQLQAGAGCRLCPPLWYSSLTVHLLPPHLRGQFNLPYGEPEQHSAERALRWLPRIYRHLPASLRFVGPYLEAQAKLRGESRPGPLVRLSNKLWVGEPSLLR